MALVDETEMSDATRLAAVNVPTDRSEINWGAAGAGAAIGATASLFLAGSVLFVLVIALGALIGAVVAMLGTGAVRAACGRRGGSDDFGFPTHRATPGQPGEESQRGEAGHASPQSR